MSDELPPLAALNITELSEMIRKQMGVVIRRSVPKERIVEILEYGSMPTSEEIAGTAETRKTLQLFIEKHWEVINSQLPCKGTNRGKCTVYPCPEGRHLDCYQAARVQIRRTMNKDAL